MTREEWAAYQREWRDTHPGHKQQARERRFAKIAAETPEEKTARRIKEQAYYAANKEKIAARAKARRLENYEEKRKKENEASRRWRENNPERAREISLSSYKKNYHKRKPAIKAHRNKRRAWAKGAQQTEVIHLSVLADRDQWICHLCGNIVLKETWSMDHLIPLSKGGDHTYENVKLAHRLCNIRRGNKPLTHFPVALSPLPQQVSRSQSNMAPPKDFPLKSS